MKRIFVFIAIVCSVLVLNAQDTKIAKINLKDINGKIINTENFSNDDKPFVICFWATWCHPCLDELNTIAEHYYDWQKETGIKIYAVSIDDARTKGKVKTLVSSSEWEYEVVIDENSDFKRAMGVNNPPHTFIVGNDGTILWQHAGYTEGDEQNTFAKYKEFLNK